jgi:hypothetical protein
MPYLETVALKLNARLNDPQTRQQCHAAAVFKDGVRLVDLVGKLGVADPYQVEGWKLYLQAIPPALDVTLSAVLRFVCDPRNDGVPIMFAWQAGHYKIEVTHSADSRDTRGGITVIMHSPPPPAR